MQRFTFHSALPGGGDSLSTVNGRPDLLKSTWKNPTRAVGPRRAPRDPENFRNPPSLPQQQGI